MLGVSADEQKAHQKFTVKYGLPFTLLSDPGHTMLEQYNAWVEKSMYGRQYMGVARITYIINEDGQIAHFFGKVKPETHSQEVLAVLDAM